MKWVRIINTSMCMYAQLAIYTIVSMRLKMEARQVSCTFMYGGDPYIPPFKFQEFTCNNMVLRSLLFVFILQTLTYTCTCIGLPGVTLTLGGKSIPTNGAEHILITDINNTSTKALLCQSELSHEEVGIGNWYLHPTQQSKENKDRIDGMNDRGWYRNRVISGNKQKVRLMRVSATAEEGVFTCDIARDTPTPVSVGIFYPSESY